MFEDRTPENLKKEILSQIQKEKGISTQAGSFADAVVGAVCQRLSMFYQSLPAVVSMLFVDETSGGFLDRVGQDYLGLVRRPGTRARCSVTLWGRPGTRLAQGSVFLTASGLSYALTRDAVLPESGQIQGELEAVEAGAAYNVEAGAISQMYVNATGLERWENGPAQGGTDPESDRELFQRIDEARKRPATSGNGWDFRRWALEVDGVGEAKVTELWDGPGTVLLTVTSSALTGAGEDVVEAVWAHVQVQKPIGAACTVRSAQEVEISVRASIIPLGTTPLEVQEELETRLREQFRRMVQTKYQTIFYAPEEDRPYTLLYNRVLALLLSIDGVDSFVELTVNGSTQDVVIPADSVPVLGEVQVT